MNNFISFPSNIKSFFELFATYSQQHDKPEPDKKLLSLFEMFVTGDVLCGPYEKKPWMVACVARREWLSIYTRYLMRRGVTIVRNFVDPRFRNFVSGFKFFGHGNLLVVDVFYFKSLNTSDFHESLCIILSFCKFSCKICAFVNFDNSFQSSSNT